MREIKFRGLNGETGWHYGIPLTNKLGTYIIFEKNPHICSQYHYIEIDEFEVVKKETVSEWTGRLDKNSVEIYNGDIVVVENYNHHGKNPKKVMVVYYNSLTTQYCTKVEKTNFKIEDLIMENQPLCFAHSIEVIGNVYENPELLGQEK